MVFDYRTYLFLLQENVMDKYIGFDIDSRKKVICLFINTMVVDSGLTNSDTNGCDDERLPRGAKPVISFQLDKSIPSHVCLVPYQTLPPWRNDSTAFGPIPPIHQSRTKDTLPQASKHRISSKIIYSQFFTNRAHGSNLRFLDR